MSPVFFAFRSRWFGRLLFLGLLLICFLALPSRAVSAEDAPATPYGSGAASGGQVRVTASGLQPAVITVTVGSQVSWINDAPFAVRLANQPFGQQSQSWLYLPALARAAAQPAGGLTSSAEQDSQPATAAWASDDIPNGGAYRQTFAEIGVFPYYASHLPSVTGLIVVIAGPERLEVAPEALLLTGTGASKELAVRAYDAAGNAVYAPVTWSSSNPQAVGVDAAGRVTALAAVGSALVYAHAGNVVSPPATVLIAQPQEGVALVPDAQIVEPPQFLDTAAGPGLGAQMHTVLKGGSAPAVGQILLGTEGSPLMGKVLTVQGAGEGYSVTLETVALVEVFRTLSISETFDVDQADLVFAEAAAAGAQVERMPDGKIVVRYAGPPAPIQAAGIDAYWFDLGPFRCQASADFGLKGSLLEVTFENNLALDMLIDIQDGVLQRTLIVLEGSYSARLAGGIDMTVAATGDVSCRMQMIGAFIPLGGPLSALIAPVVPLGMGFDMEGQLNLANFKLQLLGQVTADVQIGFDYRRSGGWTTYKKFDLANQAGTEINTPNLLRDFGFEGSLFVYGLSGVGISVFPDTVAGRVTWNIIDVKGGLKQEFDLRTPLGQAVDSFYASSYQASLQGHAGLGPNMQEFSEYLERTRWIIDLSVDAASVLADSPHGALAASASSVVTGSPVKFTVQLDPTDLQYPLLFYNVGSVQLYRLRDNQLELVANLPAAANQELFTWDWTPAAQDVGAHRFVAFVTSKLLPFLPLEVDDDGSATVYVVNVPANHAAQAQDDAVSTPADTAISIDVLANDSDPDGDGLQITGVSTPAHGSAAIEGAAIRYTPAAGYSGADSFAYTVSDGTLRATAAVAVTVTPSNSPPVLTTSVFDDFSTYGAGLFPSSWKLLGSAQITPLVQAAGGSGPAYQVLDFPEVSWQYWDSIAVRSGIVAASAYTVEAKLRFLNSVADRAGLTVALDRSTLARVDIQPNVYTNEIEFRSSYGGTVSRIMPTLAIDANVAYWLRGVVEEPAAGQGRIGVDRSTDGINFVKALDATGLTNIHGEAGVSTAGPHLPHAQFDDFRVILEGSSMYGSYMVPALPEGGTATGLSVAVGDHLAIWGTGTWCWGGYTDCSGVTGSPGRPNSEELPVALAGYNFGHLIGRIGNWLFPIGAYTEITSPVSGELYLLMNDRVGRYFDNTGSVTAQVELVRTGVYGPLAEMILVPPGSFQMGCDAAVTGETCTGSDLPLHTVSLGAYLIDKYEVTNCTPGVTKRQSARG